MYNEFIKLSLDNKYAVGKKDCEKPFLLFDGGAKIIFDALLSEKKTEFDFEKFCQKLADLYQTEYKFIAEDTHLVLNALDNFNSNYKMNDSEHLNTYGYVYNFYYQNNKIFKVAFEVTYSCNLKCDHCYLGDDVNSQKTMITLKKAKDVIDELNNLGVVDLTFTGGEFFSHPDAIEIIEYACTKNFIVNILTNGTQISDELAKKLASLPISTIRISLYGLSLYHDNFVHMEGAYHKSIHTFEVLNESRKGLGIAVSTATKDNYDDLLILNKILKDKGIEHKISTIIWPTTKGDISPTLLRIDKDKLVELLDKKLIDISETHCASGIARVRITPFGEVNPCELFRNRSFGNIFKRSLNEIFESNQRKEWINEVTEYLNNRECCTCNKKQHCPSCIGISYLENKDILAKTPSLCMFADAKLEYLEKNENHCKG